MYELTTQQKNIYNLQKYYENTAIANIGGAMFIDEKLDMDVFERAVLRMLDAHDAFHLRLTEENGKAMQYVERDGKYHVSRRSFQSKEDFDAFAEVETKKPITVKECDMYRAVLCEISGKTAFYICASHLISDAWTISLMGREIMDNYDNLLAGREHREEKPSYVEYIQSEQEYMQSEKYEKDKTYWAEIWNEKPQLASVKPQQSMWEDNAFTKRLDKTLSAELTGKIKQYEEEKNISPAVLFESAVMVYLAKLNPELTRLSIGVPVLNRSNRKEKQIMGMFISTMPLCIEISKDDTCFKLQEKLTRAHFGMFRHQKMPYSHIVQNLRKQYKEVDRLYDVMVSFQNATIECSHPISTRWYGNGASEVPLAMHIDQRTESDCFTITLDYQYGIFSEEEMGYFYERIVYLLEQIMEDADRNIFDYSILPEKEQKKVLEEFNDTYIDFPREKCIHELFIEQAEKTPDKTALIFEDKKFTYRELDEMSNSLAHFLREKGVKRNDVVPIIAKRSWHVIVAMLGVLKAGGAYMPIADNYPQARINEIINETDCKIVLLYKMKMVSTNKLLLDLERFDYDCNISQLNNLNKLMDCSYVIYTSGSTGKPKGIVQTHKCLNNLLRWQKNLVDISEMNVLADTIISFDVSVQEILYSLLNGGCLHFTNDLVKSTPKLYLDYVEKNIITTIFTTPSYFKVIEQADINNQLKVVMNIFFAGEVLTLEKERFSKLNKNKASIWNQYGPAETHVASNAKVTTTDITIGKPIANTQIYILDKDNNLLPIGVPGELCIAGAGVGKGYLNRPELTAEKFVPNPFATKENHHGDIMYHTGDLARWRADGEIEYLGRIDTQVKIRGLRIELGEIESVMGSFEGVQLTAAADKRDENNRQYLVGYYTAETEIDEKELRQHLAAKLPKYMVPNYFMHLETMPMTPSGKIDRKNLPLPDFSMQTEEYVAPETETEKRLCSLLAQQLHMEKVGVTDDFFEMGGDSLSAIEYVAKAHGMGIEFALQNVFDYPTVRLLCDYLNSGTEDKVRYEPEDFEKYQCIFENNVVDDSFVPKKKPLGNILLTGATGFLGAHVLDQLMKEENGIVYCLVRGENADDRRGRLYRILEYYFGDTYKSEYGKRIIPVIGNIEKEGLAEQMPEDIQTVIHTAASVKHYGSYSYFHKVNVEGTKHVVDFAKAVGAKLIHVSTLSVSGNTMADDFLAYRSEEEMFFYETSYYIGQPLDNVYIHSKFEAERQVYDAMLKGLDAKVIRVGNLTSRARDYKFQPNYKENAFLARVKAFLEFGLFPEYLMSLYVEFSPIDQTAEGVVKIAQYADRQNVFHLNSDRVLYFDRFLEIIHELGIPMKVVDGAAFNRALQATIKDTATEYIFEALQNDMDDKGELVYDSNIRIMNDFTLWFLKQTGFEWCEIDEKYLRGYLKYFMDLGYIKLDKNFDLEDV